MLQLRPRHPLLIVRITSRRLLHVRDPLHLLQRLCLRVSHHRIPATPNIIGASPSPLAPLPHIRDLRADRLRRIAMHQVRVALRRNQVLRRLDSHRPHTASAAAAAPASAEHILPHIVVPAPGAKTPARFQQPSTTSSHSLVRAYRSSCSSKRNPVLRRLVLPPARNHIQRQPPTAIWSMFAACFASSAGL